MSTEAGQLQSAVDDDARCELAWVLRGRGELEEAEALLRAGVDAGHHDSAIRLALLRRWRRCCSAALAAVT